ncbi:MAG: alkaline phosphatase family protein [Hyphomicrobiaceae bacterium]|nr:alkaline phosphatase family protein [Hyphomicrobiaceae bacterium]
MSRYEPRLTCTIESRCSTLAVCGYGPWPRAAMKRRPRVAAVLAAGLASALATSWLAGSAMARDGAEYATGRAIETVSAVPATPWRQLAPTTRLTRIAVGSCLDQRRPQPILSAIMARDPQLFLMLGDNVYGDIKSADGRELAEAYGVQLRHPEFAVARQRVAMLGIWDDHDYGGNDAGADFAAKHTAARLFREFWQRPRPEGGAEEGVYFAEVFGPPGARVQIIFLDTRWARSPLKVRTAPFSWWGKYEPDLHPEKTMLGERQWHWLQRQLSEPAEIRLIVSSIQVLAEGHGFERWGNLPLERDRLLRLIETTGAGGVVLLSGDRHNAAFYQATLAGGVTLPEVTASSLNRAYGPSRDSAGPERRGEAYWRENFAEIAIDWEARALTLDIRGIDGAAVSSWRLGFDEIASAATVAKPTSAATAAENNNAAQ